MSEQTNPNDDLLKFTQSKRLALFGQLEKFVEADSKVASVAVKILSDIDKQILTQQRLDVDKNNGNKDREVALLIAQMNAQLEQSGENPFRRKRSNVEAPDSDREVHGKFSHTEGELSAKQTERFTFDTFMAKMEDSEDES